MGETGRVEMSIYEINEKIGNDKKIEIPEFLSERGSIKQKRIVKIFYTAFGGVTLASIGRVIYKLLQKNR